VAVFRASAQ
jgi:hypothetical protein